MKVAFQMEPMAETKRDATNALLIMQEAQKRGYEVFHYQPETITLDNTGLSAPAAPVSVDLSQEAYYMLGPYQKTKLTDFKVIWFRQVPPFDMPYVTNTFLLDFLKPAGVVVVNNPFWIRNMPDKLSIFNYPDYLPPTLVTRDMDEVQAFFKTHKDVVIKPLYSYGGHGITRTTDVQQAAKALAACAEPLMFQPFLEEIKEGNKRIILFDGEIVGARLTHYKNFNLFTQPGNTTYHAYEPNERELEFCAALSPFLKKNEMPFVGIDFLGPYLLEINAGSVGSLMDMNRVYGWNLEKKLWDMIETKI